MRILRFTLGLGWLLGVVVGCGHEEPVLETRSDPGPAGATGATGESRAGAPGNDGSGGDGQGGDANGGVAGEGDAGTGTGTDCITLPPLWPDCDQIADPDLATDPESATEAPTAIEELRNLDAAEEQIRAQLITELDASYAAQWQDLRDSRCVPQLDCTEACGDGRLDPGEQCDDGNQWSGDGCSANCLVEPNYSCGAGDACTVDTGWDGNEEMASDPTDPTRSGTNLQVPGVDEPDLLKLDERYVYVIASGELLILDAADPAQPTELSRTAFEGTSSRLFVSGDRALVIASQSTIPRTPSCTYAYDCQFRGDGFGTWLSVVDLTDRAAPRVIRRITLSGSFLAARRVGSNVHVVTEEALTWSPPAGTPPPISTDTAEAGLEDLLRNRDRDIAELQGADLGLTWSATEDAVLAADGGESPNPAGEPEVVTFDSGDPPEGQVVLSSFDLQTVSQLHQSRILSAPGAVYATAERLYLAAPELNSRRAAAAEDSTFVHAFELDGSRSRYLGSGRVAGHVLNQFSMDEWDDHLRIATSQGWVPDPAVQSAVSVLALKDERLALAGRLDGLAPSEDIRAVRFAGNRGYVVTFKKTDPLFVIDLASPRDPALLGELKIPGFSTYLHPLDDEHLLSIGYDADEMGSFAYFDGVTLQILEVADPTDPRLLFREVIGTRGSSSEALTNHLAFNYFPTKGMLAIPMTICEGGGDGAYGDLMTFSGLLVYDVSLDDGFALHGRVSHPLAASVSWSTASTACSTWWTNASSPVKRSAFIEDYVLSVGEVFAKMSPLDDLARDVAVFRVGELPCELLDEAECDAHPRCAPVSGTELGTSDFSFLGCATMPPGRTALACNLETTCATHPGSGAVALFPTTCVPDGWLITPLACSFAGVPATK
jgi:cysteine-rich repeat protein